jgi:mono/diheme cytochrome c family protein
MSGFGRGKQMRPRVSGWVLSAVAVLFLGTSCTGEDEAAVASVAAATGLDFEVYVSDVEPIFTRLRGGFAADSPGGPSCVMCHTWQTNAPLKLQPLEEGPDGESYWTIEQSRRNFVEVARLVTPGDPEDSRLLRAPLARSEGGRGQHTGGTFWESKDEPEWEAVAEWVLAAERLDDSPALAGELVAVDFEFFQNCVQRIFVTTTPGALPCAECHQAGAMGFAGPIGDGRNFWNEEESRRNFAVVTRLIEAGEPTRSRLLMHPLAYEAGGDYTHNGPRRWRSMDDPEWQMLASWVRGERTGSVCSA